ncbi:SIR2 family NAD-dependent protein deacylase [Phnomibacter sp. MR]|uniref:SIR2 family NAD-dependent protein deacylase n=1 Tax=Phnomibacter sp. MR TaxID=3042318 RepID=UPI003A80A1B2
MNDKKKMVVLTGAGISAESGLKTFRDSEDGLWNGYDIEDVATPNAWRKNPQLVLDFYNYRRAEVVKAQPNAAHLGLVALEEWFDVTIITQNIDDLHERAGSSNVLHLHGEILKMRSEHDSDLMYPIVGDIQLGDRAEDGAQLRPHIVWFGEAVPMIELAADITSIADVFVVMGTSLQVYPAAGLLHYTQADIPTFVVDKKLPPVSGLSNLVQIEAPATVGIVQLTQQLQALM